MTRVGSGSVPDRAVRRRRGRRLARRRAAREFGTNTGRRRRTGWLDLVMLKHAVAAQHLHRARADEARHALAAARAEGVRRLRRRGRHALRPRAVPPVGAAQGAAGLRDAAGLGHRDRDRRAGSRTSRRRARDYVRFVEEFVGVHVSIVGVGPARDQTIVLPRARRSREQRASSSSVRRWPRARARVGPGALSARRRGRSCAPGNPGHGDARRVHAGRARPIPRRSPISRPSSTPISWSSAPTIRSSRASSTRCRRAGISAFGPMRPRRSLEGSKAWMKDVLVAAGVPTAALRERSARAKRPTRYAFLDTLPGLYVVKTDGLAAGKGVVVTESIAEARDAVRAYLSGAAFGDAGRTCVIEEGLTGPEVSLFALCDGQRAQVDRRSRRITSARSTATWARTRAAWARTRRCRSSRAPIVVDEMMETGGAARRWRSSSGAVRAFRGLAVLRAHARPAKGPKVLEYNVRFGDPECQVLVPRFASDLFVHLRESAAGRIETRGRAGRRRRASASCSPPRATRPRPIARATSSPGSTGRARTTGSWCSTRAPTADDQGRIVTNGGRVLTVTAVGADVARGARPRVRGRGRDLVARRPLPSRHRRPGPPVIPRYSLPEIAALFTDEARFGAWLEVEVLAVEAWAQLGVVPDADARGRSRAGRLRRRRDPRARAGHRSRRRRLRRRRAGERRASPRARGCTTASRRATSSTPRSRCR